MTFLTSKNSSNLGERLSPPSLPFAAPLARRVRPLHNVQHNVAGSILVKFYSGNLFSVKIIDLCMVSLTVLNLKFQKEKNIS